MSKTYDEAWLKAHAGYGPALLGETKEEGLHIAALAAAIKDTTADGVIGPALLSSEPIGHNKRTEKPKVESSPSAAPAPKGKGK